MLNELQKKQIDNQIASYEKYSTPRTVKVLIGNGRDFDLTVDPLVASPDIMNSGTQVAKYLFENPQLVQGKIVYDIGTGAGILGIAAGLLGASRVVMTDVEPRCIENTQKNIRLHGLEGICTVFQSDLFKSFSNQQKADLQIFNHPYFADGAVANKPWSNMMLAEPKLFKEYLKSAPRYSHSHCIFLFSWLTLAGNDEDDNDPKKQAPPFGYKLRKKERQSPVSQGVQQGQFEIFEYTYENN
jgi:16S rRNA G1207 methylase RsmC